MTCNAMPQGRWRIQWNKQHKESKEANESNTELASQILSLTAIYAPVMNAVETIAKDNPSTTTVYLSEARTKSLSPSCAQIRATTTVMEVYIATVLLITNA